MTRQRLQQMILGGFAATGAALFAIVFALTFSTPKSVEKFAAEFIEQQAMWQIDESIDSVQPNGGGAISQAATALLKKNAKEIEHHRQLLKQKVHERMVGAIAEIRQVDCECRGKWAQWLEVGMTARIHLLNQSNEGLTEFIHATYAKVVSELVRDIRIFTATNFVVFFLSLVVVISKPQANLQLLVPSVLLVVASVLCSYFYVFQQNWLLTVIYNDYLGYTYIVYLGIAFGLLCDVALNRARMSSKIANAALNAVGSSVSALPC